MHLDRILAGYGGKPVLKGLSLTVEAGDFVALIGPNGSGKSTLLKVMAGQLMPTAGTLQLDGKALCAHAPKARGRRMAYFPQSRPIPHMDVQTLVAHGRFPHLSFGQVMGEADRAAVRRSMAQTGLLALAGRPLSALSGGERQRAYLAMLMAQEADILLLDEPGSFLDIGHQLEIMGILRALHRQGKTVIFAAHDLPMACTYARRTVLLESGHIVADGPPSEVAAGPAIGRVFGVRLAVQREENALFAYRLDRHDQKSIP